MISLIKIFVTSSWNTNVSILIKLITNSEYKYYSFLFKEDFHYTTHNIILILKLLLFFHLLFFSIFDSVLLIALSAHLIVVKLYLLISEIEIFDFSNVSLKSIQENNASDINKCI